MRVIYVAPRPFGLGFGGLEAQMLSTAEHIASLGASVDLLSPYDRAQFDEVDLVHLFGCDHVLEQISGLLVSKNIPYVVSTVFYPAGTETIKSRIAARLPRTLDAARLSILRRAGALLPNSRAEARACIRFGAAPERIHVIPNAASCACPTDARDLLRNAVPDLPPDTRVVLSVGRIEPNKNTLRLVHATERLGLPLLLIGGENRLFPGYVSSVRVALEQRQTYWHHLHAVAWQSPLLCGAYSSAHVHALVSHVETPGLASLEAGYHGANLVVGACAPVQEYFAGRAWLVDSHSVDAIAKGLHAAVAAPRDHLEQSGHIRDRFSWSAVAAATAGVYEHVLRNATRA